MKASAILATASLVLCKPAREDFLWIGDIVGKCCLLFLFMFFRVVYLSSISCSG
jgi:hypothetical protein